MTAKTGKYETKQYGAWERGDVPAAEILRKVAFTLETLGINKIETIVLVWNPIDLDAIHAAYDTGFTAWKVQYKDNNELQ